MSSEAKKPTEDDKVTSHENLLMDEGKSQPTSVITAEDKDNTHIAGNDVADCSNNVPTALPDQNCSSRNGKIAPMVQEVQNFQNVCIFCLEEGGPEEGHLMHMCTCSVLTHKKCALEYIRFPGNMNDRCCQCREKLKFKVVDKQTPMKQKYVIAFTFLVIFYLTMVGVSIYLTMLMIPYDSLNIYLYIAIVANLSILWPLLIVFILTIGIDGCFGPRDRSTSGYDPGCYCSGGCGDCGGGDCNDCGGDGDACGVVLCVLALLAILVILIVATVYLFMSLCKVYKSFELKSKKEIKFHHEGRRLHTLGSTKPCITKLVTSEDV